LRGFDGSRLQIVPLSSGALDVLEQARALCLERGNAALVFPSKANTPLSDNTLSKTLRDAEIAGTPHGFRSTFKSWCVEGGILGGDPSQDYFADGVVEDITIALGRLPWLFVVGSRSAFTYKNRAVDLRQVGSELGVRYLLMGSVRKDGNQVRISAQLADASHGGQIWAEQFNGELGGLFEMEDLVAASVSATHRSGLA
jgi:TolB-like protein